MDIGSMVTQGLVGMQRSQTDMTRSAHEIAQATATPAPQQGGVDASPASNFVEPLVNIQVQQTVFDSSAKVVKVADENLGKLLDARA